MITIKQIFLGILYFSLGLLLAYILPIKIGGVITQMFANSSFFILIEIIRYITVFVFAFIVPLILLTNSKIGEQMEAFIGA